MEERPSRQRHCLAWLVRSRKKVNEENEDRKSDEEIRKQGLSILA